MSEQCALATTVKLSESSRAAIPREVLSLFTSTNVPCSDMLSTDILSVLKLRLTSSLLLGSTVKKERVSLTAPPKTICQSLANPWVLAAKTPPILELETECFRNSEKGRVIIRLEINAQSKNPENKPGITPNILLPIFRNWLFFSSK